MIRTLTLGLALLFVALSARPSAQYPPWHPCDYGPVYTDWCQGGTQNLCTPFHVGAVYQNPYGIQEEFYYSYWSDEYSAWMLHGAVLGPYGYPIDVIDGTRQYPYCQIS